MKWIFFSREIAFLAVLNFFPVQKLIFSHFWNYKNWNLDKKKFSWNWFIWFHEFFLPGFFFNFLTRCVQRSSPPKNGFSGPRPNTKYYRSNETIPIQTSSSNCTIYCRTFLTTTSLLLLVSFSKNQKMHFRNKYHMMWVLQLLSLIFLQQKWANFKSRYRSKNKNHRSRHTVIYRYAQRKVPTISV